MMFGRVNSPVNFQTTKQKLASLAGLIWMVGQPAIALPLAQMSLAQRGVPLKPPVLPTQTSQPQNLQPQNLQPQNLQPQNLQPQNLQPQNLQPKTPQPQASTTVQQYQAAGVTFSAPAGFSPLQPLGGETVGIIFPAAAAQTRHVSVRLADLSPTARGIASLSPRDLAEYARFNFFGISNPPQQTQTRRFLGQSVTGDILMQSNRNGGTSYIEFYIVPLSEQRQVAIAFEVDTELPLSLLENTIKTVTESLRELPSKKKRR
ncbi:MAG: hypothetical protein MH252_15690 [Thermosynechococcaceae cyanobacterium MS004]|nr:hypothetical protein [Thermosynechococcaceae cyanobacterium MS004]